MKNRELQKQYKSIKRLIDRTQESTHDDLELQGHWGRYLCVLVSGFFENAISAVYVDFVESAASPQVTRYTINALNKISNPKASRFVATAYQFKKEWGEELDLFFEDGESRKSAIDSIMANRHNIAHGKQSNISVHQVREYLEKGVEVVTFLENQCTSGNTK